MTLRVGTPALYLNGCLWRLVLWSSSPSTLRVSCQPPLRTPGARCCFLVCNVSWPAICRSSHTFLPSRLHFKNEASFCCRCCLVVLLSDECGAVIGHVNLKGNSCWGGACWCDNQRTVTVRGIVRPLAKYCSKLHIVRWIPLSATQLVSLA